MTAMLRSQHDRLRTWNEALPTGTSYEDWPVEFEPDPCYVSLFGVKTKWRLTPWVYMTALNMSGGSATAVKLELVDPRDETQSVTLFDDESATTTNYVTATNNGEGYLLPTHKAGARDWIVRWTITKDSTPIANMVALYDYVRMGDDWPIWWRLIVAVLAFFGAVGAVQEGK